MPPKTVAWVVGPSGADLGFIAAAMGPLGFRVIACDPDTFTGIEAELVVLPWAMHSYSGKQVALYGADGRPTLLLVDNDSEESSALEILRPGDGIGRSGDPPNLLARRLRHLDRQSLEFRNLLKIVDSDELTGLLNRRRFEALSSHRIRQLEPGSNWAITMIDLDNFKVINDAHGHVVGDHILRESARRLKECLGANDVAARYGGEEFVVLVNRDDRNAVINACEQFRAAISSRPFILAEDANSRRIAVFASAGLKFLERGLSFSDALQQADHALYAAKAKGRDQLVIYDALESEAVAEDSEVQLLHFQNVAKVVTERTANLVSLFGRRLVQSARRDAMRDKLTQLWNRRYFDQRMVREIELARKDGGGLALAIMDIDHFGNFNRTYGLPVGDAVLRAFGVVVAQNIRQVDWAARYGGEEFAVIVPGSLDEVAVVAERIRHALQETSLKEFTHDDTRVTVSIGVCAFVAEIQGVDDLVQLASDQLRIAKNAGRNRVQAAG